MTLNFDSNLHFKLQNSLLQNSLNFDSYLTRVQLIQNSNLLNLINYKNFSPSLSGVFFFLFLWFFFPFYISPLNACSYLTLISTSYLFLHVLFIMTSLHSNFPAHRLQAPTDNTNDLNNLETIPSLRWLWGR